MARKKVHAIAPPSRMCVHLGKQRLDEVDLAADLGPAEHGDERPLRLVERLAEVAELLLHQEAGHGRLEQPRDRLGAGVRPVRGAERVVHVEIAQRGEALGEAGVVGLLAGIEPRVLRDGHAAARQPPGRGHGLAPRAGRRGTSPARRAAARARAPPAACEYLGRARPWAGRGGTAARRVRRGSRRYLMVGSAARIRVLSVTAPSFTGQLKSTRTSARLPSMALGSSDSSVRFTAAARRSAAGPRSGPSSPSRCRTSDVTLTSVPSTTLVESASTVLDWSEPM